MNLLFQTDPALGLAPWLRFANPVQVLCTHRLEEVRPILSEVEKARSRGLWAAGFVTYEAARAFDPALATHNPGPLPLAWFGLFNPPLPAPAPLWPEADGPLELVPDLEAKAYAARIADIKEAIARGETYQVNFTFRLRGHAPSDPASVFARLHHAQRGGYSALIETPDFSLCSASPELFFLQQDERLTCRPMKGTAARGANWSEDEARGKALQRSEKNRAENVMIVDMIRNDLGRLVPAGAVQTRSLFDVQRLPTLWQMTSTVEAHGRAGLDETFSALFPCASITGAPKVRTTQIIKELETSPRGIYTGAMGFAGPGGLAQFNVAIRTLAVDHRSGRAEYGIGSGVVWDSESESEYDECRSKAHILQHAPGPFQLLATMAWRHEAGFVLLDRHLDRLRRAATYFGFPFNEQTIRQALHSAVQHKCRIRLLIAPNGSPTIETSPLPAPATTPWKLAIAQEPVDEDDPFLYFKTTHREIYERARRAHPKADDVLLVNRRGEVTETTIANLAIRRGDRWITPPISCGLLDGIQRAELLACGEITEGVLTLDEVRAAPALALLNSVRGWWAASL